MNITIPAIINKIFIAFILPPKPEIQNNTFVNKSNDYLEKEIYYGILLNTSIKSPKYAQTIAIANETALMIIHNIIISKLDELKKAFNKLAKPIINPTIKTAIKPISFRLFINIHIIVSVCFVLTFLENKVVIKKVQGKGFEPMITGKN
jgi:hypothetical protein